MLAVVIPTINSIRYLQQTIASLPDLELTVIVIDQASIDGTGAWLKTRPEIITLSQRVNIGVAPAWNLGILSALHLGADYVAVLNHDIVLARDTLPTLVYWHGRGVSLPTVRAVPRKSLESTFMRQRWVSRPGDFCGFLITRAVIDKVGWFDEKFEIAYMEDLDYEMRCLRAGVQHGSCHDALVHHYGSRAVYEGGVDNGPSFRKNAAYFERKWGMHYEVARRQIAAAGPPTMTA